MTVAELATDGPCRFCQCTIRATVYCICSYTKIPLTPIEGVVEGSVGWKKGKKGNLCKTYSGGRWPEIWFCF